MSAIVLPYEFVGGTRAIADQVDANFNALLNAFNTNVPTVLQAPTTFYVAPGGADIAGNGLASTSPAATMTYIFNLLKDSYNLSEENVVIQLANGTYNESVFLQGVLPGQNGAAGLTIQGNMASPNLVTVIGDPSINATNGAQVTVQGVTVQSSVSNGLQSHYNSRLHFQNVNFAACTGSHLIAARNGLIQAMGNYSIVGGGGYHGNSVQGGRLFIDAQAADYMSGGTGFPTVTLTGTPAFTGSFIHAANMSLAQIGAVFAGTGATGIRSITNYVASINIFGQGTTYLPGSIAGTDSNGGVTA